MQEADGSLYTCTTHCVTPLPPTPPHPPALAQPLYPPQDCWTHLPYTYNAQKRIKYHHPKLWRLEDIRVIHYVDEKPVGVGHCTALYVSCWVEERWEYSGWWWRWCWDGYGWWQVPGGGGVCRGGGAGWCAKQLAARSSATGSTVGDLNLYSLSPSLHTTRTRTHTPAVEPPVQRGKPGLPRYQRLLVGGVLRGAGPR